MTDTSIYVVVGMTHTFNFKNMIPVKIITTEEARKFGLSKPSGGGEMEVILVASGKIGNNKAEKIEIINRKTNEKQVLFDKGRGFKFKNFDKKML